MWWSGQHVHVLNPILHVNKLNRVTNHWSRKETNEDHKRKWIKTIYNFVFRIITIFKNYFESTSPPSPTYYSMFSFRHAQILVKYRPSGPVCCKLCDVQWWMLECLLHPCDMHAFPLLLKVSVKKLRRIFQLNSKWAKWWLLQCVCLIGLPTWNLREQRPGC